MTAFKTAMNMLFRHYENDAAMVAKLIECDRITDYRFALDLLVEMLTDVGKVLTDLDQERGAQELPERTALPLTSKEPAPMPTPAPIPEPQPAKKKRGRKAMKPDELKESKRLSAARRALRTRGYEVPRGSKTAYWDKWTERRRDWERSGKYGFTYEKNPGV